MGSPSADSRLSSPSAFVQGGVQDPCDDSCSICLEQFSDINPVTVTSCKHEYHLQCILEWSQRSKDCPMCWRTLSLKDPNSQELLDAVSRERSIRQSMQVPSLFQRTPGDEFEFHVPAYADDSDFHERIMQHLAAAATAHHFARRENLWNRSSSGHRHPQFVVVPTLSSSPTSLPGSTTEGNLPPLTSRGSISSPIHTGSEDPSVQQASSVGRSAPASNRPLRTINFVRAGELNRTEAYSLRRRAGLEPVQESQQRTVPSELQSLSESLKSRFAAASSRYKESFTKATSSFRERLRARTSMTELERLRACTNMADLGARAREVSAGVVRALERISLESTGKSRGDTSVPTVSDDTSDMGGCSTLAQTTSVDEAEGNSYGPSVNANVTGPRNGVAPQSPPIDDTDSGFDDALSKEFEGTSGSAGVDDATVLPSVA